MTNTIRATYKGGDIINIALTADEFQAVINEDETLLLLELSVSQFVKFIEKYGSGDRIQVQSKDNEGVWIVEINDLGDVAHDGDTTIYIDVI